MFFIERMQEGGWMMWVIFAVSIIALAISLERFTNLFLRARINADAFLKKVNQLVEAGNYSEAIKACNIRTTHPLPTVLKAGITRADRRDKEIERAMEEEVLHAMPKLQRGVDFLGLLGNSSTLLGLLGTIFGLIQAFSGVSAANAAARQQVLAEGISMAMYTTAFGLIVAIPILYAHTLISGRADRMLVQLEEGATSLMVALSNRARPNAVARLRQNSQDVA